MRNLTFLLCFFLFLNVHTRTRIPAHISNHHSARSEAILGYKVIQENVESDQFEYVAQFTGSDIYYGNQINEIVQEIKIIIELKRNNQLRIRIFDNKKERDFLPELDPYPFDPPEQVADYLPSTSLYSVTIIESPFSITITRKSTNETMFSTLNYALIFSEYYLQWETILPTRDIFGLGERASSSMRFMEGTQTILPMDQPWLLETGVPGNNLYGCQPMYLAREKSGNFHIVLLRNSAPMDVQLSNTDGRYSLQYRIVLPDRWLLMMCRFPE